jgi:hypothetical protein
VVEQVDLVVVERDDDLELRVVVEVADPDVLAIRAVAVIAAPFEGSVAAVVPRPAGRARPEGSNTNTCDPVGAVFVVVATTSTRPSPVEVGRRHAAGLRALPAAAGRSRPTGLERSRPPTRSYAATVPSLPPTTISLHAVAVEVGDDAGRVDRALGRRPLAEQAPLAS